MSLRVEVRENMKPSSRAGAAWDVPKVVVTPFQGSGNFLPHETQAVGLGCVLAPFQGLEK
jgi:hypothetical protein